MLKRTKFFLYMVILVFVVLLARLAYLQIFHFDYYWARAEKNRLRILPITAPRGEIFARGGEQLVTNRPGFTVSLVDLGQGYSKETIAYLALLLEMEEGEIRQKIESQFYRRYLPLRLKTDVSMEVVSKIAEKRLELPGVLIEVQPIRNYVNGDFLAHVLGYMGEGVVPDWAAEHWEKTGYEYEQGEPVGQAGIELAWEPYLKGEDGGLQVEVNSTGQAIGEFERVEPRPGCDIYLTIDAPLQSALEEALHETVEDLLAAGNRHAGEAAAVVLDPRCGAILAMADIPAYDPNTFSLDFPDLEKDPRRPLVNKTIEDHYPVGSTFKMVTALAALQEGAVTKTGRVSCGGVITRYNATKSCYRRTAHGSLNVVQAIQKSCNIFFYEMGLRLGIDTLAHYAREFGFGSPVGLTDIFGEKKGIVASREYKSKIYQEPWYPAETMDAAIGQSFNSITPLQLSNYTAMIANGGIHYRPYLVEKIVDSDGNPVLTAEPEILHRMEVDEAHWDTVREGMSLVPLPGGTGARLADFPIRVAAKTGTAQVVDREGIIPSHILFVAFAPLEEPEIALAVFVKYGEDRRGNMALPIARRIMEVYFQIPTE